MKHKTLYLIIGLVLISIIVNADSLESLAQQKEKIKDTSKYELYKIVEDKESLSKQQQLNELDKKKEVIVGYEADKKKGNKQSYTLQEISRDIIKSKSTTTTTIIKEVIK